jgi:uncharacterized protein (TIRG00374 family)
MIDADLHLLLLAVLLSIITNMVISSHKLELVLKSLNGEIPLKEIIFVQLGSYPIKFLLPFQSGKFLKVIYFKKYNNLPIKKGTSAVLFDLISDIYALLLLLFLALSFSDLGFIYKEYLTFFIIMFLVVTLFFFKFKIIRQFILRGVKRISNRIYNFLKDMFVAFTVIPLKEKIIILLYAFIIRFLILFEYYILFLAIGIQVPLIIAVVYFSLIILISQIPVSISGFGVREASVILFFVGYASYEKLLGSGLLISFVDYFLLLGISFFFLRTFLHNLAFTKKNVKSENLKFKGVI